MNQAYESSRTVFKENPQMALKFVATIAKILDQGDSVEVKKNKDGTPKIYQVKRKKA